MHALTSREAPRSGAVAGGSAGDVGRLRPVMACLFAGNLAGNCDAAVDTWPVIHSSTTAALSGDQSSAMPFGARAAAEEPESIRNVGRTQSRISDAAGSAPQLVAHQSSMCLSRAAW